MYDMYVTVTNEALRQSGFKCVTKPPKQPSHGQLGHRGKIRIGNVWQLLGRPWTLYHPPHTI